MTTIAARPIKEKDRIASLDVLRGFALLGILPMNIQYFSMISAAYSNPMAYGDLHGANLLVWLLCRVLADEKFMTIFSMLFGAGILLMTSHVEAAGQALGVAALPTHGLADFVRPCARLLAVKWRHSVHVRNLWTARLFLSQSEAAHACGCGNAHGCGGFYSVVRLRRIVAALVVSSRASRY